MGSRSAAADEDRTRELTINVGAVVKQIGENFHSNSLLPRSLEALHHLVRRGPAIAISVVDGGDGVSGGLEK